MEHIETEASAKDRTAERLPRIELRHYLPDRRARQRACPSTADQRTARTMRLHEPATHTQSPSPVNLTLQIGQEPRPNPLSLIEDLAGPAAKPYLDDWLRSGRSLTALCRHGAPDSWPAELRKRLAAAVRLVRSADQQSNGVNDRLKSTAEAARFVSRRYLPLHLEHFGIILLDPSRAVQREQVLFRGNTKSTSVDTQEVLRHALACGAEHLITWHNHPSGDCRPSDNDLATWARIDVGAELIGVCSTEHVIVTEPGGAVFCSPASSESPHR